MRVPVSTRRARLLARGVAILAVAGSAAGCSSGTMRFQDEVFASAAPTSRVAQQQYGQPHGYTPPQSYPTAQSGNVDTTYTGSISRQAVQPVTVANAPLKRGAIPVPSVDVGQSSASQPVRQPLSPAAAPAQQPFPTMTASGPVTRQPAPPLAQAAVPAGVDRTATGSIAPRPVAAKPLSQNATVASLPASKSKASDAKDSKSPAPANKAPLPAQQPIQHVAVLPQGPRVDDKRATDAAANADVSQRAATAGSVYTVQPGDTLSSIAKRLGTNAAALKQANRLDTGLIRVGQKLVVPGATIPTQTVASAQPSAPAGVDPIVTSSVHVDAKADAKPAAVEGYTPPRKDEKVIEQAVEQATAAPDATGIGRMRWPVRGRVLSGFGASSGNKANDGIDIAVPEGTPIKAAENGVVIYAGDGLKDFGKTVLVRHENGLVTVYGHASEIEVQRGDTVRRGQQIARSGLTGNADSPKLHFEVRKNSTPVDPTKYLE